MVPPDPKENTVRRNDSNTATTPTKHRNGGVLAARPISVEATTVPIRLITPWLRVSVINNRWADFYMQASDKTTQPKTSLIGFIDGSRDVLLCINNGGSFVLLMMGTRPKNMHRVSGRFLAPRTGIRNTGESVSNTCRRPHAAREDALKQTN